MLVIYIYIEHHLNLDSTEREKKKKAMFLVVKKEKIFFTINFFQSPFKKKYIYI